MRTIVAVLVIALCSLSCAFGQELLQNPSFKAGPEDGVPDGWSRYGGTVPESQLKMSAEAHSGDRAVRLIDTGPNERDGRWSVGVSQTVDVHEDGVYLASVWAKCFARNHHQAMNLQLTFLPSRKVFATRLTPEIGGDWHRFSALGRAPAGDNRVTLYIYSMHFWTCDYLIDDASLREVSAEKYGERFALAQYGGMGLDAVRPLNLSTPILAGGKAAAIICVPEGEDWEAVGKALQDAIKERTGVELPLTTDGKSLLDTERTIIALGNMNNNFVIERLHWNKYLVADSLVPGPGKYVLRTVHEPFNFRPQVNVLTVEASDLAGAQAGAQALLKALPQGKEIVLDAPLLINPTYKPLNEEQRQSLTERPLNRDPWRDFWQNAELYRDRGDIAYAEKAKDILFRIGEAYQENPSKAVTWPEETSSNHVGPAWDVLEECPIFSEAERLKASNILLTLCYELPRHVSGWGRQSDNDTITWNHTTFPILGIYWLARHFQRWYGDVDGKIGFMMAEVRGCFRGQKKSWKPQCDADGYLTIVPRHLMEYTLAENDYEWFESGNCRRYAEYLTALSDNRGVLPGLGDSGYGSGPGYELNGLPMALWYYKDGRYLWRIQQVMKGKWKNPYDQSVRPRKWFSMAGLTVTRLHPENYNYTIARSYYGEPIEPPNVPFERAFDKITFRENIEPDGEFLLLDGYSRGKHLHYDGNAIIKFNADGEDWLIDGDYLVRNTTEHTMVSVIKDGRCDKLIPVCAGLEHCADLEDAAFTQTVVRDYNGANWFRHIAWLKGEFFLVIDECEALHDGDYTFEAVWKTLDRGKQELTEGRIFSTQVETWGGVGSRGIITVRKPAPDVPTAVKFMKRTSQLDFGLDLPKGQYNVTLFAHGLDTGTDSFWLSVDGGEQVAFHIPIGKFGPSSGTHTKDQATPNVDVTIDGMHRFSVTLRENYGVMLDRVLIRDAEGETVADFQAEDAPPLPKDILKPAADARFFVKSDGTARSTVSTRVNNVGLKIRKLHQRFGGQMKAGDRASVINVFYNDKTDAPKDYDVRRLGTRTALILKDGKPFGVFTADAQEIGLPPNVTPDAAMMMIAGSSLYAVDGTRMGVDGPRTAAPVSLKLNLDWGYGLVHVQKATTVHLPDGQQEELWEGDIDFDAADVLAETEVLTVIKVLPAALAAKAIQPEATGVAAHPDKGLTLRWHLDPVEQDNETARVMKLHAADLNGDRTDETIALRGRTALCLDQTGKVLWEFETEGLLRAVTVADLEQDGQLEVLIGGDDEHFYILDPTGKELKRHKMETLLRVGTSSVRQPRVSSICVGDIDLDGANEIIIGTKNGNIARFDLDLNRTWAFDRVEHGTRDMALLNLDDDPKLEIVAENKYGAVEVVDVNGNAKRGVYSELGDVEMAVGDLDGDGKLEIANGSSTGAFTCQTYGGPKLFSFPNYGYGVMDVRIASLKPDDPPRILIASETGYVYALDEAGKVVGHKNLQDAALQLAVLPDGQAARLLVGCRDGYLYALDGDLNVVGQFNCGWPVDLVAVAQEDGKLSQVVLAGEGNIAALAVEEP